MKAVLLGTSVVGALSLVAYVVVSYAEMDHPLSASLVHAWDSSLFLFLAAFLCETGLTLTRKQYKLSKRFRNAARESGFLSLDESAPLAQRIAVMKQLFSSFPTTVSEMVHSQEEDHGQVFKALMMIAGVLTIKIDFADLTPCAGGGEALSAWAIVLNHCRFAGMVMGVFGFPLVPSPKGVFDTWRRVIPEMIAGAPINDVDADELIRHNTMNNLHKSFAMPLLVYLPFLELVALPSPLYQFFASKSSQPAMLDAVGLVWLLITATRLLVIVCVFACMFRFAGHMMRGAFLGGPGGLKCFWMEYSTALGFSHVMQLLALAALFDFHHPGRFTDAPLLLKVLAAALTAHKLLAILKETLRNLRLAWGDMEYTEEQYAWAFSRWCAEEKASQAELAAIVAGLEAAHKAKAAAGPASATSESDSRPRPRSKSPMRNKGKKAK